MEDLRKGRAISHRYRNRRIGEFLKELNLAEGRSTGVPKILRAMRQNGSHVPAFESDEDRTWFLVRLPARKPPVDETNGRNTGQVTGQDTGQVTVHVDRLLAVLTGEMSRAELQAALKLAHRDHFVSRYLRPAIKAGVIEMTLPDKPTSRRQRYRRTIQQEERLHMNTAPIVSRVWSFCTTLRDDGVSYGDYLEQLTYLIFLKMADEYTRPPYNRDVGIPNEFNWQSLNSKKGAQLEAHYVTLLRNLGTRAGMLGQIFTKAQNKIQDPAKLYRLIDMVDDTEWVSMGADVKGDIYEGLLEKNAEDTKSGAGQYFTPRALIRAMVE